MNSEDAVPDGPVDDNDLARWYDTHSGGSEGEWVEVELVADPTTVRTVRLRRTTVDWINGAAAAQGVGPAELLRRWIEERVEQEGQRSG